MSIIFYWIKLSRWGSWEPAVKLTPPTGAPEWYLTGNSQQVHPAVVGPMLEPPPETAS